MKSFDVLLKKIKPFGTYQILVTCLYGFYAELIAPVVLFLFIFLAMGPEHRCVVPENLNRTRPGGMSIAKLMEHVTPPLEGCYYAPDTCSMRDLSSVGWAYQGNVSRFPGKPCPLGTEFLPGKWVDTPVTRFGLICEKGKAPYDVMTMYAVGAILGTVLLSHFQDHVGRKPTLVLSYIWVSAWCVGMIYAPSLAWYKAIAFFLGIQQRLAFPLPWNYCQEFTDIDHQAWVFFILALAFGLGCCLLSLIAYLATSGVTLILWCLVLHAVLILPSLFIDESPRWLLSCGKVDRARKIIRRMISLNHSNMAENDIEHIEQMLDIKDAQEQEARTNKYAFWTLYTNGWGLALKVSGMSYAFIACMLVYEGINLNLHNFQANPYLVFAIVSLVELPSGLILKAADYIGRVPLGFWSFLLCGAFAIGTIFVNVQASNEGLLIFCIFMTKLGINVAWNVVFLMMTELFPTSVRGTATGVCSLAGTIVSVAVPAIAYSGTCDTSIPMIVYAAVALLAGVVIIFIPETAGLPIVDTLDEEKRRPVTFKSLRQNLAFFYARNRRRVADMAENEVPTQNKF